ncbi:surface-adhesin E family protein [Pandoraea sp. SD6-2]|uniref:surface-adhesin E family protein n=1 Tax=Pandoraea sp. SD6-2 TaxID=1286093 RepID=UPI0035278A56
MLALCVTLRGRVSIVGGAVVRKSVLFAFLCLRVAATQAANWVEFGSNSHEHVYLDESSIVRSNDSVIFWARAVFPGGDSRLMYGSKIAATAVARWKINCATREIAYSSGTARDVVGSIIYQSPSGWSPAGDVRSDSIGEDAYQYVCERS